MEFKKSYKFRDGLPFAIFFGFFLIGYIVMFTFVIIEGISGNWSKGAIIGIVFLGVCFVILLFIVIILASHYVMIDEEKIVSKVILGTALRFNINDIYKIEKKPGAKGVPTFIIYGNSPQINSPKCKVKTINFIADKKREEILKHFITNPEVWQIEVEAEYY